MIATNPSHLYVIDTVEKCINISEAEELFGMKWLEWEIKDARIVYSTLPSNFIKLSSYSDAIFDKLVIQYMGKEQGYGLFARKNIDEGEIIAIFTGEIVIQEEGEEIVGESTFITKTNDNKLIVINGTNYGNMVRFIQHLPKKDDPKLALLSSTIDVAKENLAFATIEFPNGLNTCIFVAPHLIKAGEIIGCSYYEGYWDNKSAPSFFLKDGSIVK